MKVRIKKLDGFFDGQIVDMPDYKAKRLERRGNVEVIQDKPFRQNKALFDYKNKGA